MKQQAERKPTTYQDMFIQLAAKVEKWLIHMAALLLVLLVSLQLLLTIPFVRGQISLADQFEGARPASVAEHASASGD